MIAPATEEPDLKDPTIWKYVITKEARQRIDVDRLTDEQAKEQIGKTKDDLDQELIEIERDPKVIALIQAQSPAILARFIADAEDIANSSGLVRIHRLPARIPALVAERLDSALATKTKTLVRFDDILDEASPQRDREGVLFAPVRRTSDGTPLIIDVPLGEFSASGFAEAVSEHRNALEVAVVGNARTRLDLASTKLAEYQDELKTCKGLSDSALKEMIELNQTCTVDGCYKNSLGERISRARYCSEILPRNSRITGT